MSRVFAIALIVGIAGVGCGGSAQVKVSTVKKSPKKSSPSKAEVVTASPSLGVSNELLDQCMVKIADTNGTPHFDFNEDDLLKEDRMVLDAIGKCVMSDGPLAGRSLQLVGRADPRGTQEYNLALGTKRAGTVTDYLARLGVARDQLAPTTRGDIDASGRDEVGWRGDRRVDITLMEDLKVSSR
jgi:peptidoglycan-associated lipoprotein